MKRKTQERTNLRDWVIYRAKTPNGWSIVIMPENILIDNYHTDKAHIHPNPLVHEHKIELGIENPDEIEDINLRQILSSNIRALRARYHSYGMRRLPLPIPSAISGLLPP